MSCSDKIIIRDLTLHARIGLSEAERAYPQRIVLSAEIGCDTRKAAFSKNIGDTVCYSSLSRSYQQFIEQQSWVLVEELLEQLALLTLQEAAADTVRLRLRKFTVPAAAWVAVEIYREKPSPGRELMLEASVSAQSKRRLLSSGRHTSVKVVLANKEDSSDIDLPFFLEMFFEQEPGVLADIVKSRQKDKDSWSFPAVEDFRGRPGESFPSPDTGMPLRDDSKQRKEELFHCSGRLLGPPASLNCYPEQISELETVPFSFSLSTCFERFTDAGHIVHRCLPSGDKLIVETLRTCGISKITSLFPLRLNRVRMGFEFYRTRFLGSLLGLVPVVEERFFLEITARKIDIFSEEDSSGRQKLPFEQKGLLAALDYALQETGLYSGLLNLIYCKLTECRK